LLTNGPVIIRLKEIGCRHYACYDVDISGLDGIIACLKVRDDVGVGEAGGGRGRQGNMLIRYNLISRKMPRFVWSLPILKEFHILKHGAESD
jgi:hypothetical protein